MSTLSMKSAHFLVFTFMAVLGQNLAMPKKEHDLSPRLRQIIEALPLRPGVRILEIGCGPGAAARVIAGMIKDGSVLAIDRSAKAIAQAKKASKAEMAAGRLEFRQCAIEDFELEKNERPFDFAFAVRVGALDGRHPEIEKKALERIAAVLKTKGKLYIDGGKPLKEIRLPKKS